MLVKKLFISLLLTFSFAAIFSQKENIRFRRITINDGLSLSSVYAIYQDKMGFMWFGTEDGLNRYDGENIKIYRPDISTTNTICYKWIEHIAEDSTGMLWFGSKKGLSAFNPRIETFYNFKDTKGPTSLTNDSITYLMIDKYNYVWVGTVNGLNMINPKTLTNQQIVCNQISYLKTRINEIVEGNNDLIWIASNSGLFKFSYTSNICEKVQIQTKDNLPIEKITSITVDNNSIYIGTDLGLFEINSEDKIKTANISHHSSSKLSIEKLLLDKQKNKLWITCNDGLYYLNLETNEISQLIDAFDSSHSLSINTTKPIHKSNSGDIWYGTFGDGLYQISSSSERVIRHEHTPGIQTSLSENAINCIYEDKQGSLWLGTFGAGICIYNPRSHKFELLNHDPLNPNSMASNFVWTIFEDNSENVWIGTNNKGITKYNPEEEKYQFYDHGPNNPNSLSVSSVRDIFQDSKGRIWAGTDGGGLNLFIANENRFKKYVFEKDNPSSISDNSVRVIYEDKYGILWIGTRNGLNRFDPKNDNFKRFLHQTDDATSISHNFIYASIHQDTKDNLWIGTYGGGLNIMDYKTEKFVCYQHNPENPNSLSDNIVFAIYEETGSDYFWIGTNNGLDRFNSKTKEFKRFGLNEGLPNEVIYSILPDNNNNIWLSTNLGLCRLNLKTYKLKNFDVNDGLQSNEFNGGAFHKGKSGKLYFGGVYGLNIINPENISQEPIPSKITITDLEILGKKAKINKSCPPNKIMVCDSSDNYIISENISYIDEITIDNKNKYFSLEFSALGDLNSSRINYAYQMVGLDEEWHYSGSRNYVSYANMSPGEYNFRVKAQNADGVWSAPSSGLKIHIKPPFWKTPWFYLIELLTFISIVFFIYGYLMRAKTNKLLTAQNQKISEVNQKLVLSEKGLKELNATKDKFFSIIAHDLKNPFTSLLSVGEVINSNYKLLDEEEKQEGFKQVYESAKNINKLLENLLTWSRSQSKRINFEPLNFNLSKLVNEITLLYKNEAKNKGVILTANFCEDVFAFGDREMINTVIRNLVNNAIKFCTKGESVNVELLEEEQKNIIYVKDTGTGIPTDDLDKLFKIDKKLKTTGTAGEKGTGLGLILCKEFVSKNNGDISVESVPGKGSTFKVVLPKNSSTKNT